MAKNIKHTRNSQTTLALPVAVGTLAGMLVLLGTAGLKAFAHTDRATTALINEGKSAPGLKDGEASVELIGVALVAELAIANAINQYDKVYRVAADGTYTATASGNTFVGYALQTLAAPGNAKVAFSVA